MSDAALDALSASALNAKTLADLTATVAALRATVADLVEQVDTHKAALAALSSAASRCCPAAGACAVQ